MSICLVLSSFNSFFQIKIFEVCNHSDSEYIFVFQQMWKCKYMETSAKNGTNVTELFEELLKLETSRVLSLQPIEETEKKKGIGKIKEKCVLM